MTAKNQPQNKWTASDDAKLTELYGSLAASQIGQIMGRTKASIKNRINTLGLTKGNNSGCFMPGMSPWNKGIKFDSGGRSHETRFKVGDKPHTWNPIGHERVSKDGYLQRKMTDTGITRHDYVFVHRLVWLEAGREIAPGHVVVFRDGDKRNFALDNLEMVSRGDLMRRNSFHQYGPEIASVVQLRGAITRQINKWSKSA